MGAAVVELIDRIAVVDGEGVTLFPEFGPGVEPAVVGLVEFDALTWLRVGREMVFCGKRDCGFPEVSIVEFEGDFFPLFAVVF